MLLNLNIFKSKKKGTLLNLNIFKSDNKVFVVKLFQGQNTSCKESLFPCSQQYELNLLHIILKFTLHSWQVPRSSVGRALYRESGPSQDGDPVPGNLPFFFFFFNFLFTMFRSFSHFCQRNMYVLSGSSFYARLLHFITLVKVFFLLLAKLCLFLHSKNLGHAPVRC